MLISESKYFNGKCNKWNNMVFDHDYHPHMFYHYFAIKCRHLYANYLHKIYIKLLIKGIFHPVIAT